MRTLIYKGKPLAAVLKDLGKRSVTSVLIEGGGKVLGEALDARLIDKVQIYLGSILTGGPAIAFQAAEPEPLRMRSVSIAFVINRLAKASASQHTRRAWCPNKAGTFAGDFQV
jgi:riboflavin biosynthesis pyrimidine reductase